MPTSKPRFTVTCEPETHEVISRLAELQGRTRGSVVAELLDEVVPVLSRTIALLEAASEAPTAVRKGMLTSIEKAHDELMSIQGDANRQVDMLFEGFAQEGSPHVVTRGSGQPLSRGTTSRQRAKKGSRKGVSDAG